MNVAQLTAEREKTRILYEAAATIRRRLTKAAEDLDVWGENDGDSEVWTILWRGNGWGITAASLEAARADAHARAKEEVDEGYDFDEPEEPAPAPFVPAPSLGHGGGLSWAANVLAVAAAAARAPTPAEPEESEYVLELKAARAKVDALYDTAREILSTLASLPHDQDPEDVATLVDENETAPALEETGHDKLAYLDTAIDMRRTLERHVAAIVAEATQRRAKARKRAPGRAAEREADELEAASAEEAIQEFVFGEGL